MALFVGRWHPLLVHLPIGMLIMAFLLELFARKEQYAALKPAVPVVLLAGGIGAVLSCIAGYFLSFDGGYDENTLSLHMWLGIAVAVFSLALWLLKRFPEKAPSLQRYHFPLLIFLIFILSAAGHFGGSLTHGSDYLAQAMPGPVRKLFGIQSARAAEMPVIADIQEAAVFGDVIQPILSQRCLSCHNSGKKKGDLRLDSREMLLKGGENGQVIRPGDPGKSELYHRLLLPEDHDDHMPPEGKTQLEPEQIKLLHWWIASGAPFEKKVKEITQPDTIKPLLLALESGGKQHAFLPEGSVKAASPDSIKRLRGRGVKVMAVAQGSNFLQVSCINDTTFGNAQAPMLLPLKEQLVWLELGNTEIGDEGLKTIGKLGNLTRLHLEHTRVSDAGLAALASCKNLRFLNLFDTGITDQGLQHLLQIPSLQEVHLYKTGVTPEGVQKLQKSRPELRVDTGNYTLPLLAADTVAY